MALRVCAHSRGLWNDAWPIEVVVEMVEGLGLRAVDLVLPLAHPSLLIEHRPVQATEHDIADSTCSTTEL